MQNEIISRLRTIIADAEADIAQDYADAETTGERPDLHDNEITLSLKDAKALEAALSAAEPPVAVNTPFEIASRHIPEARVSLLSRAIRQGLNDYGWKNFGTLPEVLMGYIVQAEKAEADAHPQKPRDSGHDGGDLSRSALSAQVQDVAALESQVTHEDICNTHEGGPCNCDWSAADEYQAHPDDIAVDRFAAVMKAKLAKKRDEGRSGWEDKDECSQIFLSQLLREHVEKGDPVDVGNLAMMLHQRGERIASLLEALQGE